MKKDEFLTRLTWALAGLPYARRQEIIDECARRLDEKTAAGMAEEGACASLGSPEDYARPYLGTAAPGPQYVQYACAPYPPAPREDKTGYIVGLIFAVLFLAIPVIPVALCGVPVGVIVFLCAFLFFPISGLALFGAFMISLGIFIISLSVLVIYAIIELLIFLIRGITGKKKEGRTA